MLALVNYGRMAALDVSIALSHVIPMYNIGGCLVMAGYLATSGCSRGKTPSFSCMHLTHQRIHKRNEGVILVQVDLV